MGTHVQVPKTGLSHTYKQLFITYNSWISKYMQLNCTQYLYLYLYIYIYIYIYATLVITIGTLLTNLHQRCSWRVVRWYTNCKLNKTSTHGVYSSWNGIKHLAWLVTCTSWEKPAYWQHTWADMTLSTVYSIESRVCDDVSQKNFAIDCQPLITEQFSN